MMGLTRPIDFHAVAFVSSRDGEDPAKPRARLAHQEVRPTALHTLQGRNLLQNKGVRLINGSRLLGSTNYLF